MRWSMRMFIHRWRSLLGVRKIFVLQWHRNSDSAIASTPSSGTLRSEVDPEYGEEGAL